MAKVENLFNSAKSLLDSTVQFLEGRYPDKKRFHRALNTLKRPQNVLKKKLILKLVNGKKKVFQSFRVQYNDANGPFMGGTRFSPTLSEAEVKDLAFLEIVKSAICDLPFGGAFGGVNINTKKVAQKDITRVSKLYSQFLSSHIGNWKDVLSPELGTSEKTMSWMMDGYEKKKKFHSPASFTSNRLCLDGAPMILTEYLKATNFSSRFRKLDIAIYGFGNRAYTFAKNIRLQSFRIVAISDSTGGIVNSNGFDIETVKGLRDKFTSLKEVSVMEKIEFITNEKLLELPVDVLVVASERTNCNKANAKLLLELASFGISSNVKNTEVLPDVLLNSGFSALSHLDWIQKMHGYKWAKEDVLKKLRISVIKSFKETKEVVDEMKITYRQAAYYLGIKRIIDMMMARGRI